MVSSTMSLSANSKITLRQARPARVSAARSRTVVLASKKANEHSAEQGPSQTVVRLFGALAAVQIALLPVSAPAEAFNLFPKTATSQSARDALNKKTDNLPTLKETGKELFGGGDPIGANSAKDVGKAVDRNTPDIDLTKNPKNVGKDVKKAIKNSLPDVSAVPTADEIAAKARGGASKASGKAQKNINILGGKAEKSGGILSGQANKAGGILGGKADKAGGILGGKADKAGGLLSGKANSAAGKAQNLGNKAASKVPSVKDIQRKLNSPLGTISMYDLSVGLQGQDRQSQNDSSPDERSAKRSMRGMNADIGPLPDRLPSPEDAASKPDPSTAGNKTTFAKAGVGKASDVPLPRPDKAIESLDIPNPVSAAKSLFSQ